MSVRLGALRALRTLTSQPSRMSSLPTRGSSVPTRSSSVPTMSSAVRGLCRLSPQGIITMHSDGRLGQRRHMGGVGYVDKDGNEYYMDPLEAEERILMVMKYFEKIQDKSKITKDSTFEELGLDSFDIVELVMTVEEEFDLQLSDQEADKVTNVQDLISCIINNPFVAPLGPAAH